MCLENQGWNRVGVRDQVRRIVGGRAGHVGFLGLWIFLPTKWEAIGEGEAEEWYHIVSSFLNCVITPILEVGKLRFRKVKRVVHIHTA